MDDHRRELIVRLCTAAGMLIEDRSADAILLPRRDDTALIGTVDRLVSASGAISAPPHWRDRELTEWVESGTSAYGEEAQVRAFRSAYQDAGREPS